MTDKNKVVPLPRRKIPLFKFPPGKTFPFAGSLDLDACYNEAGDFKPSTVVVICPTCRRRMRPLLSKLTSFVRDGSYCPACSVMVDLMHHYVRYHSVCRKCNTEFEFETFLEL